MSGLYCWFYGPSIISAASNVVFWTFFCTKTCCVVCHAYCFCYGGTNTARKNVWKPHFIRLLRWFNFSQSGSRKTIEKLLKELQWNQQFIWSQWYLDIPSILGLMSIFTLYKPCAFPARICSTGVISLYSVWSASRYLWGCAFLVSHVPLRSEDVHSSEASPTVGIRLAENLHPYRERGCASLT